MRVLDVVKGSKRYHLPHCMRQTDGRDTEGVGKWTSEQRMVETLGEGRCTDAISGDSETNLGQETMEEGPTVSTEKT